MQQGQPMDFYEDQRGQGWELPGKYELVLRTESRVINPGDPLKLQFFITGYGRLGVGPKLYFTPPPGLIVKGTIYSGYKKVGEGVRWGGPGTDATQDGFTAQLTAGFESKLGVVSMFSDYIHLRRAIGHKDEEAQPMVRAIMSERPIEELSPVFGTLETRTDRPGVYKIYAYLTYHNGENWNVSIAEIELKVRSWPERNATLLAAFGLAGIFASIYFGLQG